MRKRSTIKSLRMVQARDERERYLREEMFIYLRGYHMMNVKELNFYREQLKYGRMEDADKIWEHLVDRYAYTRKTVRKKKLRKGQYPEGDL